MRLLDGPAAGSYRPARAPALLRAVVDGQGRSDVLDQPTDRPQDDETVSVYELIPGTVGMACVRGAATSYALGEYRHLADVDGETVRDNYAWAQWAIAHEKARDSR